MKSSKICASLLLKGMVVAMGFGFAAGPVLAAEKFPPLAPLGDMPIPPDNKMSAAKVELGKLLYFDPRVGGDASVACSTCHEPKQGWGFSDPISRGYPGTVHWRNSQTVVNTGYLSKLFWQGNALSLEKQAPAAAMGGVAGNGSPDLMEARLSLIPEYRKRFKEVFGGPPIIENVWKAIAAFERTLVHNNTPLDRYLKGDKSALTAQQVKGKSLFEGKAGCIQCHNGPLATDEKFHNIGMPPSELWSDSGIHQITYRFELYAKGSNEELYRTTKGDPGAYYNTKNKWDMGRQRTAPLRYIAYSAPYMAQGQFFTLEEVVDFYDRGGVDEQGRTTVYPQNKSPRIKKLNLTDQEKADLVAFLGAFSGDEIKMDKPKLPDYAPLFTSAELKAAQAAK